jgi:hypothetical protein
MDLEVGEVREEEVVVELLNQFQSKTLMLAKISLG